MKINLVTDRQSNRNTDINSPVEYDAITITSAFYILESLICVGFFYKYKEQRTHI